jgi:hypothetical protein
MQWNNVYTTKANATTAPINNQRMPPVYVGPPVCPVRSRPVKESRLGRVKVFLYTLLRTVVFVGVALLVWFLFGWSRWGWLGAVLSIVVGGVVAFAVGYLFFDKARREAAESVEARVSRRKRAKPSAPSRADEEAAIEDAVQDEQRRSAGLGSDARRPTGSGNPADDEA